MERFMFEALKEAQNAFDADEVPIGCVIVKDRKIIAKAHNQKEKNKNPLKHAEIIAIEKACKKIGDWRLDDCELYVTVEPCIMCAGACLNARIKKVFFGAYDGKGGGFGGIKDINLANENLLNHKIEVENGILEKECKELIQKFFKQKRVKK